MARYCSVFGCSSSSAISKGSVGFHTAPKGESGELWVKAIPKMKGFYNRMYVCSLHFTPNDYAQPNNKQKRGTRPLKQSAVPSANLHPNEGPQYKESENKPLDPNALKKAEAEGILSNYFHKKTRLLKIANLSGAKRTSGLRNRTLSLGLTSKKIALALPEEAILDSGEVGLLTGLSSELEEINVDFYPDLQDPLAFSACTNFDEKELGFDHELEDFNGEQLSNNRQENETLLKESTIDKAARVTSGDFLRSFSSNVAQSWPLTCMADMTKYGKCIISSCTATNRSYHELPADITVRQLWIEKIQPYIGVRSIRQRSTICGAHFEKDDYIEIGKNRLKKNAVPSIFETTVHKAAVDPLLEVSNSTATKSDDIESNNLEYHSEALKFKYQQLQKSLVESQRRLLISEKEVEGYKHLEKVLTKSNELNKQLQNDLQESSTLNQELQEKLMQAEEQLQDYRSSTNCVPLDLSIFEKLKQDATNLDPQALELLDSFYKYGKTKMP